MEEKEIIIGRSGGQPFPISQDGVSEQHASLTICSDGTWVLKDLNSRNGTFIRNERFEFERIVRKVIRQDTVIRLGCTDDIRSIQFMAVRLVKDPEDFSYEFTRLQQKWSETMTKKDKLEKQISQMTYIPMGASLLMLCATMSVKDINIIRAAMFLPSMLSPVINSFSKKKLKQLNEEARYTFVCPNPKCGMPLTETEIKKGQCLKCKAHI